MSGSLEAFRSLLDHLDPGLREDQLAFFRALDAAGPAAVDDLGGRVVKAGAPQGLRQLVLEASYYHPWPEWTPVLGRLLRHETHLGRFTVGVEALGRVGQPEALALLQELSRLRAAPDFQSRVSDVLARAHPEEAFRYHLDRLLEGSANAAAANEAAQQLVRLVGPASLEPLRIAVRHPDLLISRHALRLIQGIPSPEAAAFLLSLLAETFQEIREDRSLKAVLGELRGLPPAELREAALAHLAARLEGLDPGLLDRLREGGGAPALQALEPVVALVQGEVERMLVDVLRATLDARGGRPGAVLAEATEAAQQRARRLAFVVDAAAEGLAGMHQRGLLTSEEVLPLLESGVREQLGREGLARALARVAQAEDTAALDLLLASSDGTLRVAALEALEGRTEAGLRPFLLKACRDKVVEVAQRALLQLGKLPDPEGQARSFLAGPDLESIHLGLRFVGLHRLVALAGDLLALVEEGAREELSTSALAALGEIRAPGVAPRLLALLHSGQGTRMQVALAEALRDLGEPEAAEGLCARASELRQPILHAVAVEALVQAHATPEAALDGPGAEALQVQALAAWLGRNPWGCRLRVARALPRLCLRNPSQAKALVHLLTEALAERKTSGGAGWTAEEAAQVAAAARELSRKAEA